MVAAARRSVLLQWSNVVRARPPPLRRLSPRTAIPSHLATTSLQVLLRPLRSSCSDVLLAASPRRTSRRSLSVAASPVAATDCLSCDSLPSRPPHSLHAVLITGSDATSWPARFSSSDAQPAVALCAAIDSAHKSRMRAAAADATADTTHQPARMLASLARITRHSHSTSKMQSAQHTQHSTRSLTVPFHHSASSVGLLS